MSRYKLYNDVVKHAV